MSLIFGRAAGQNAAKAAKKSLPNLSFEGPSLSSTEHCGQGRFFLYVCLAHVGMYVRDRAPNVSLFESRPVSAFYFLPFPYHLIAINSSLKVQSVPAPRLIGPD